MAFLAVQSSSTYIPRMCTYIPTLRTTNIHSKLHSYSSPLINLLRPIRWLNWSTKLASNPEGSSGRTPKNVSIRLATMFGNFKHKKNWIKWLCSPYVATYWPLTIRDWYQMRRKTTHFIMTSSIAHTLFFSLTVLKPEEHQFLHRKNYSEKFPEFVINLKPLQ